MPIYLECFTLPDQETEESILQQQMRRNGGDFGYLENGYPCTIFTGKGLSEVRFKEVTIFYGGNGSGKTTLLNVIAERLKLKRSAPFNTGEMFPLYTGECSFTMGKDEDGDTYRIPNGSRIITSDDVFDYMLAVRHQNGEVSENSRIAREEYARWKYGDSVRFTGMDDYDALREQISARRAVSRRSYIHDRAGREIHIGSNGETALEYFSSSIKNDKLYLLDEPENSMSPGLQLKLLDLLNEVVRYCGCQIIMATHSPFLLSADGARIYDLDAQPASISNWWELENVRVYRDFFRKNEHLFAGEGSR